MAKLSLYSSTNGLSSDLLIVHSPLFFGKINKVKCLPVQGPVVRRPISANPGLNFNLGFFLFCLKAFYRIIFPIVFRASSIQIVDKKNYTEFAFKAFISEFKFHINPGLS